MFCAMGFTPSALLVDPSNVLANGFPVARITDIIPIVNIPPFGLCHSPLNPEVIIATAAAMGVPTPMPCIPVIVDPWIPPTNVLIDGVPAVTIGSTCFCAWEGVIELTGPSAAENVEVL
jgi:hypothetical protein